MSLTMPNKKEAVLFSYSLILDKEGKLITEVKSLPVEYKELMQKAFSQSREERVFFTNLVLEAKRKFIVVHEWLEKYCRVIS